MLHQSYDCLFHLLISASMGNCAERGQFGVKCWCIVYILWGFVKEVWLFVFHQNSATSSSCRSEKGAPSQSGGRLRALYLSHFSFRARLWAAGSPWATWLIQVLNLPYLHNHATITSLKNFSQLQFAFLIRSIYMQMRLCDVHPCNAIFST